MQPDQQQQFSEQLPSSGGNLFTPKKNTDRIGPTCLEQVIPQADAVGFFVCEPDSHARLSLAQFRPPSGTLRLTPLVSLRFGSSCLTKSSRNFIPKNLRPFTAAHNNAAAHNRVTISVQSSNYSQQGRLFLLLSPAAFSCITGNRISQELPTASLCRMDKLSLHPERLVNYQLLQSGGSSEITRARRHDFAAKDAASLFANRSGYRSAADICPELIRAFDQLILRYLNFGNQLKVQATDISHFAEGEVI